MIIHPDLRALRSDDAPQRLAQQSLHHTMARWRANPDVASVIYAIEELASGKPLEQCPALAALFAGDGEAGFSFVSALIAHSTAALSEAPLAHVPMRHFSDGCTSTLLLARNGQVTLSIIAIDGAELARRPEPRNISFAPNETWELILNGRARADLISCQPNGPRFAELKRHTIDLAHGSIMYRDGSHQARQLRAIDGTLVSLRLQRRGRNAGATREYALADGQLVHQAAGNPRDSRLELMLALLCRMHRIDAAPLMADLARSDASSPLRWQALRECLALDTGIGFAALSAIAASGDDPLAGPAGALSAQLVESHPELKNLTQLQELNQCPG